MRHIKDKAWKLLKELSQVMQRFLDLKDRVAENVTERMLRLCIAFHYFCERVSLCWEHAVICAYMYVSLLWSAVQVKIWNKIWVSHVICKVKTWAYDKLPTIISKETIYLCFIGDPDLMAWYEQGQSFISTAVTVCEGRSVLIDRCEVLLTYLVACFVCSLQPRSPLIVQFDWQPDACFRTILRTAWILSSGWHWNHMSHSAADLRGGEWAKEGQCQRGGVIREQHQGYADDKNAWTL